ncbi:PREDICTED: putative RING-H2 finger protein ATL37 [Camelina sativa]|uniref:RING-type E3 ubiquitin transferase n=1 Tax=Camelina sativa TaxID=90675 RepID=A0ABM0U535_CAMSA|nr:PREDICTED: putative RING-H2 finger protein ATL37 [Camelina sativa]
MRLVIHGTVGCVLLFFQCLPCVTCQQNWEYADYNKVPSASPGAIVGTILFTLFLVIMFFFFVIYGTCFTDGEARGHEVLHSRATVAALDKEVIESFPTFLYSEVKGLKIGTGGVECAICLYEFEDEDTLRWMPPCSHTFHGNCIDVWLSSRSTCPVCRANLSLKPGESFPYPCMDLETGNARRDVIESHDDISLVDNIVTWNNDASYRATRSRSTGSLSNWRMAKIFYPRSHSTGRSLAQLGKNLDRFTLQLPEEVQRKMVSLNLVRRSHMALPQAMSSRQGYRDGCVGSERSGFFQGQQTLNRAISKSLSFSIQAASFRSTIGRDDVVLETSEVKEKDLGEQSFRRLMPEKV